MVGPTFFGVHLALNNCIAVIDDEDWPLVMAYAWYGVEDGGTWYAYANTRTSDGRPTTLKMHRLIMNAPSGVRVDHINRNGLDNRRENLRLATAAENAANSPGRAGSSQYKGVYRHKGPGGRRECWRAMIRLDGRRKSLGYFDDEEEAARAYDRAALAHFGDRAYLNFPEMRESPHPEG